MAIRIPDFLFAQGTGSVTAPGEVSFETRNALASAQSVEKEMSLLNKGLSLAGEALKGGDKVKERLRAARDALGARGDSGALRWLLDHAAAEQARREGVARRGTAMRKLVGTIKSVGDLPVPFAMKAELGRHLVQQALRHGLLQPEEQDIFETTALSQLGLQQAQRAIAKAGEPGQALAIVETAKAEGSLLPHDIALLERQARERDAVATARHHARLAWKEQDDLAAFTRGELPEPLSEDSFHAVHGARGAHGAQLRYKAARAEGEALAQIRGKDPAAIAEAEGAWQGDPAVFAAARSKDAAERRRDPVGYVLATQPGLAQALMEAGPEEAVWLLWQAQAAAGIPKEERVIWSRAQREALADEWDAIPTDSSGGTARLDFLHRHVQSLPPALRGAAIRTLVRQGITDGTEAELAQVVQHLEAGRFNPARSLTRRLTPTNLTVVGKRNSEEQSSRTSPPDTMSSEINEQPLATFPREESELLAAAHARVAALDAVALIDDPEDLDTALSLIRIAFLDYPEAAAELEARAREYAAYPPLPANRDTEGRVRNFNEWAGHYGYYRDTHIISATEAVKDANYEVQIGEDGSLGVIAPGEEDAFTTLSAEEVANLNLSQPEDRALFKLMLDAISGAAPLEELLAVAEERDPTKVTKGFHPKGGPFETVRPSESAELIRLASDALASGADPAAVTAALKAGLFPTSNWLVLGELLFSLTPFGLALDVVDAVRAIEALRESDDEAERETAWDNLVIAMVGIAPVGDALKLGARNIGTAKKWLRRLADRQDLTTEQLIAEAEHFAQIGLRKKRASFQIERLVGEDWKRLRKKVRSKVKREAARLYGKLAERLVRPAAQARLQLDGYRVFGGETKLNYEGVPFRIDVVGVKEGATPIGRLGEDTEDTIEVAGVRYLLKDVRLIDAKFASAGFTKAQRAALRKLDGKKAVERYVPLIDDMPLEDLAEILNQIDELRAKNITITVDMVMRHAESFEKGTTIADFVAPLIAAGLAAAIAADGGEAAAQPDAKPAGGSN